MIEVKRWNGGITYGTEVEIPSGALVERGVTRANLEEILRADRYSVAHLVCFCDTTYAGAYPQAALTTAENWLWYDASGRAWLDPGSPEALSYVTALCRECAAMGFDEIMLDGFCYPTNGDAAAISLGEDTDRTAVLQSFVAALRTALPENTVLSVAYRSGTGALGAGSGLTKELLGSFDRVYAESEADLQALTELGLDSAGDLVLMTWTRPETGSYVLLS